MSKVLLIDTNKRPLNPIHPAQARQLLRNGKAAIFRRFPFILILKHSCPESPVGTKDVREFLKKDPPRLENILKQAKRPLADAAAVNITRFTLLEVLKATKLPVETGSGGLTKFNRTQQNLPKSHWLDACCVGASAPILKIKGVKPLMITANGHGTRQSCRTDKFGFPIRHCSRIKFHFGFQTGDIVKAVVTKGKKTGTYVGRIATRATGSFNISTSQGLIQGVSHKYCKSIHKKDGYGYAI